MDNMIGIRIKTRRDELHLTPKEIKAATGIGSGHLSEMENGKKLPSTPTLIKLADVLECSIDWLLFGKARFCESPDISLTVDEIRLLELFNKLSSDDRGELLDFIQLKIRRKAKTQVEPSLNFAPDSSVSA